MSSGQSVGILSAVELETGRIAWQARDFVKAQLLAADGRLIILDEDGNLGIGVATPNDSRRSRNGHCSPRSRGRRRRSPAAVSTCATGASSWRWIWRPQRTEVRGSRRSATLEHVCDDLSRRFGAIIGPMALVTVRAAANRLGVSYSTLKRWVHLGQVRTTLTSGGHHRISDVEIDRLLAPPASRAVRPGAPRRSAGPAGRHARGSERAESSPRHRRRSPRGRSSRPGSASCRGSALDGGHHRRRCAGASPQTRRRSARGDQIDGGHDCPRGRPTGPAHPARRKAATVGARASISPPRPAQESDDSVRGTSA